MKYLAKPVIVNAYQITEVIRSLEGSTLTLKFSNGVTSTADAGMTVRYAPRPGDYWVVQADGYTYLNPKHVFEAKYAPIEELTWAGGSHSLGRIETEQSPDGRWIAELLDIPAVVGYGQTEDKAVANVAARAA